MMNINVYSAIFNETKISRIIQYMTNSRSKTIIDNETLSSVKILVW